MESRRNEVSQATLRRCRWNQRTVFPIASTFSQSNLRKPLLPTPYTFSQSIFQEPLLPTPCSFSQSTFQRPLLPTPSPVTWNIPQAVQLSPQFSSPLHISRRTQQLQSFVEENELPICVESSTRNNWFKGPVTSADSRVTKFGGIISGLENTSSSGFKASSPNIWFGVIKKMSVPKAGYSRILHGTNTKQPVCKVTPTKYDITLSKTEDNLESGNDDDVEYLYSVESVNAPSITEEIDLSPDFQMPSIKTSNLVSKQHARRCSSKSFKRKVDNSTVLSRKRQKVDRQQPQCSMCSATYETLSKENEYLYIAKCGHFFCNPCTSGVGYKKECKLCNCKMSLRKIFI